MTAEPVPVLGATEVAAIRQEWTQSEGSLSLHFGLSKVNDCHVDLDLCVRREEQLLPQGRLDLWRHGSLVQSEALSATGEIFLPNLEADNYEGEVTTPSGESIFFSLELQTE